MPAPDSITITNAKLADLASALSSLDGLRTSANDFRPYRFDDEGATTWLIAENIVLVQDALRAYQHARRSAAAANKVTDRLVVGPENAERVATFMADLDKLEAKTVTIKGLKKISRKILNAGAGTRQNPVPPSVLAKLSPILED